MALRAGYWLSHWHTLAIGQFKQFVMGVTQREKYQACHGRDWAEHGASQIMGISSAGTTPQGLL